MRTWSAWTLEASPVTVSVECSICLPRYLPTKERDETRGSNAIIVVVSSPVPVQNGWWRQHPKAIPTILSWLRVCSTHHRAMIAFRLMKAISKALTSHEMRLLFQMRLFRCYKERLHSSIHHSSHHGGQEVGD